MCDIDGVLGFLTESAVTALNSHFGLSIVVSDMHTYWIEDTLPADQRDWLNQQFTKGVFYANVAPDYSAIAALDAMHRDGLHIIVSSDRPAQTTRQATTEWLGKWRVPFDELRLEGRGGKRKVLSAYGPARPAILIDDDPAKALTIARPGVQVWSPTRPWTPANWQRYPNYWVFPSWDAALERLAVDPDVPIPQFSTEAGPADTPSAVGITTHSEGLAKLLTADRPPWDDRGYARGVRDMSRATPRGASAR